MLITIISRSSLKLDHVGSKTRLLGHQATQVSDLGPLWPSCFLLLLPQLIVLHLFFNSLFRIYIYNHKIITQDCLVTVFI